jgi:hypothetical protein
MWRRQPLRNRDEISRVLNGRLRSSPLLVWDDYFVFRRHLRPIVQDLRRADEHPRLGIFLIPDP